jgi:hypothetical protein
MPRQMLSTLCCAHRAAPLKSIRCDVFATIEPSGERCPGCCSAGIWQTQPHIPWAKPLGGPQRECVPRLHDPTWPAGMMGRRARTVLCGSVYRSMLVQPRGQPITTMAARGGADRSLRPSSNRQRCDRDYKSCEERAHAEECQDIVHFGHGIPLFELANATVARRRRSCNHLPITGLGQH